MGAWAVHIRLNAILYGIPAQRSCNIERARSRVTSMCAC